MKEKMKYGCFLLLFLAVACKTSQEAAVGIALSAMSNEERIQSIVQSGLQYNDLSSNLKLTVRRGNGKETGIDAQLRIVKGEAIQISLRIPILGSEAFRIVIGPEKVLIIDRLNRQYLSESTRFVLAQTFFDFDYYALEALLTNQLFIAGKKEIGPADYSDFRVRKDRFRAHLTCSDRQKINYDFESDYTNRVQSALMQQENGSSYLQCTYGDWGLASNNRTFPMTVDLQLHMPDNVFGLSFSFKSLAVDTGATIDSSIPNRYQPIPLEQAIRLIKSLL
jgi:hypothetical protein